MIVLRANSRRAAQEHARATEAGPSAIARITSLAGSSDDDHSGELILAAAALLTLLFANLSFVSVASRLWRGELR